MARETVVFQKGKLLHFCFWSVFFDEFKCYKIDMIKFARIGAAVSNSSANCLEAADIVIGSSNENGTCDRR